MSVIDILSFCFSLLGIYGPILFVLYLLPRNVAPRLSTLLEEAQRLLRCAEEVGAVPLQSKYKHHLDRYPDLHIPDCPSISCPDS